MTATYETEVLLVEVIVVVCDVSHRNHTLAMVLVDSSIDTIARDAADVCIELLAQFVAHELYHLVLDGITLGVLCYLLHVGTMLAKFLVMLLVGTSAALCILGEQAVNHRVWITTDRGGKMRVVLECQAKVTDVVNGVLRLHHGTQGYHLDEVVLWLAFTVSHQLVQALGGGSLGSLGLHLVAELHHELTQGFQLLWVWVVVDTIRQRLRLLAFLRLADAFRNRAVGKEHEFLYKFVGILRTLVVAAHRLALLVDVEV